MHNTQSRLPVNDNDVITLGATIGTFEAVVFFSVKLVTSQVLCQWHKNNSPVGKVSTICWIYLKFPVTLLQQLLVFAMHSMGLHYCAQGSYVMTDIHASAN